MQGDLGVGRGFGASPQIPSPLPHPPYIFIPKTKNPDKNSQN